MTDTAEASWPGNEGAGHGGRTAGLAAAGAISRCRQGDSFVRNCGGGAGWHVRPQGVRRSVGSCRSHSACARSGGCAGSGSRRGSGSLGRRPRRRPRRSRARAGRRGRARSTDRGSPGRWWRPHHPVYRPLPRGVDLVIGQDLLAGVDPQLPFGEPTGAQRGDGPGGLLRVGEDGDQESAGLEVQRAGGEVALAHVHRPDDVDLVAGHGCTGPPARTAATTSRMPCAESAAKPWSTSSASWIAPATVRCALLLDRAASLS